PSGDHAMRVMGSLWPRSTCRSLKPGGMRRCRFSLGISPPERTELGLRGQARGATQVTTHAHTVSGVVPTLQHPSPRMDKELGCIGKSLDKVLFITKPSYPQRYCQCIRTDACRGERWGSVPILLSCGHGHVCNLSRLSFCILHLMCGV